MRVGAGGGGLEGFGALFRRARWPVHKQLERPPRRRRKWHSQKRSQVIGNARSVICQARNDMCHKSMLPMQSTRNACLRAEGSPPLRRERPEGVALASQADRFLLGFSRKVSLPVHGERTTTPLRSTCAFLAALFVEITCPAAAFQPCSCSPAAGEVPRKTGSEVIPIPRCIRDIGTRRTTRCLWYQGGRGFRDFGATGFGRKC